MRRVVILQKEEPVLDWTDDSTIRLCEIRHINARIVASLTPKDIEVINAIGAYKGVNMLVRKIMAVSPGRPTNEKSGDKRTEILASKPEYCSNLTNNDIGKIIFNNQIQVFNAFGKALSTHFHTLFIDMLIFIF